MRETRNAQASIFDRYAKHEIGNELAMMSEILDNCAGLIDWVEADLVENGARQTGRAASAVLRGYHRACCRGNQPFKTTSVESGPRPGSASIGH
jgi:hypothetical protein